MGIKRGAASSSSLDVEITEDEAALYDRQIRLWGLESQKRLRDAKILIIGLGGLGAEVVKNIALAGVKSITLVDNKQVGPSDCSAQFLVAGAEEGKNRAEASQSSILELNPNVEVLSEPGKINEKSDDYFKQFKVVCATDCSLDVLLRLDKVCRENRIMFFCGDVWGFHGFFFVDLNFYKYLKESSEVEMAAGEPAPKKHKTGHKAEHSGRKKEIDAIEFGSLEKALSFKSGKAGVGLHKKISKVFFLLHILLKFRQTHQRYPEPASRSEDIEILKALRKTVMEALGFDETKVSDEDLSGLFGEISPVCAVVGGVLAQEIIKAVCADSAPLKNFFLFNGNDCSGVVESIG